MPRNPEADATVQIVTDPAQADQKVAVVGDQVLTATPADAGQGVVVQPDGTFGLGELGTAPAIVATGLTGAVAATRYVGGTVSGAPTEGTFAVGDFVIDQTAQVWICIGAGTPGTWDTPGSGRELDYAEVLSNLPTVTAIGLANRIDVAGLQIDIVSDGVTPIYLEAYCAQASNDTTSNGVGMAIVEGTIGGGAGTPMQQSVSLPGVATAQAHLQPKCRVIPSAGAHSYKVMVWVQLGGNGSFLAGAQRPMWIGATSA